MSESAELYLHSYAIVGGSFTGISCYRTVKSLVSSEVSTIVFEKVRF